MSLDLKKRRSHGRWVAGFVTLALALPLAFMMVDLSRTPVAPAMAQQTDFRAGLGGSVAIKPAVRAATTGNISNFPLSTTTTIDDIALAAGDRLLVKNQTDGTENGIWIVDDDAEWERAPDWDGPRDIISGTFVFVRQGTTNSGLLTYVSNSTDPTIGTDSVTFTSIGSISTTAFVDTLHDDASIADFLTTLGFSAYFQSIVGSANASALASSLGFGTAADEDIGTSGSKVPLLNGTNTHSGINTFSGNTTFSADLDGTGDVDFSGATTVDIGAASGTSLDLATGAPSSGEVNASGYLLNGSSVSLGESWGAETTFSNDASKTLTGCSGNRCRWVFHRVAPSVDDRLLQFQFTNSGVTDTGSNYDWANVHGNSDENPGALGTVGDTEASIGQNAANYATGSDTDEWISGFIEIIDPEDTDDKWFRWDVAFIAASGRIVVSTGGGIYRGGAVDGITVFFESGNLESGTIQPVSY